MTIALTSPVTGSAQTGLATPTYTHVSDIAPDSFSRQNAVTALGGTQTGVRIHSASDPFTVTFSRPRVFQQLGKPNPVTGLIKFIPNNRWRCLVRKGVLPLAGQPVVPASFDGTVVVPAGSDTADAPNLRAMMSFAIGCLTQVSAGFGDSLVSGVM